MDKFASSRTSSHRAVFGIYDSRHEVELAVEALKDAGFRSRDVSVLMPQLGDSFTFAHERSTKAPEGAAAGTSAGALIGGAFGWLIGIGAVSVFPFLGPFVAAGPIMSTLAGMGVGGAVGGLSGALIGLGAPEYEAKRYEDYVKEGSILVSVHVDDAAWARRAQTILEATGAHDVAIVDESPRDDGRGGPHLPGGPTAIFFATTFYLVRECSYLNCAEREYELHNNYWRIHEHST